MGFTDILEKVEDEVLPKKGKSITASTLKVTGIVGAAELAESLLEDDE